MDGGFLHETVTALEACVMALMGFIGMGMRGDIQDLRGKQDSLQAAHGACELNLANFKTDVANNYSKEVNTQASLGRIHDRLDQINETMDTKVENIQTDIKTILRTVGK